MVATEPKAGWLDEFVPYRIFLIAGRLTNRLRGRLRSRGYKVAQWRVISVLSAYGTLTIGGIVDKTHMEQPTVSRIVVRLEEDNLATRELCGKDSRQVNVTLTDKGREVFADVYPVAVRHEERALDGFSEGETALFLEFLSRVQKNLIE